MCYIIIYGSSLVSWEEEIPDVVVCLKWNICRYGFFFLVLNEKTYAENIDEQG